MDVFKNDYDLHTGSDTELLLNMLITEKEECINKLDGMFGFALFDENKRSILFARDFMGRIPLYYYKVDKKIIVASELKSITHTFI